MRWFGSRSARRKGGGGAACAAAPAGWVIIALDTCACLCRLSDVAAVVGERDKRLLRDVMMMMDKALARAPVD